MIPIYKALIRPIIEYANPVWNPYTRKYIDLIEDKHNAELQRADPGTKVTE